MDLVIKADGTWVHEGTPIGRPALIKLFARVLRRDPEGYVLVTPAEKLSITVEDVPFLIVDVDRDADDPAVLRVRTNIGDEVCLGPDHPVVLKVGPGQITLPYVRIRGDLEARFGRTAYYQLIEMAALGDDQRLSVSSAGMAFDLGSTV